MKKIMIFVIIAVSILATPYKTIETASARIVFEEGSEKRAQEIANYIDKLNEYYGDKSDIKLNKIPIVLRGQDNYSNGSYTNMPNRLEYILIPPINGEMGVTPWLMDLSIHEYRHYTQFQMARENTINKFGYALFGNMYSFLMTGLTIPNWAIEGDAVSTETELSDNGRGRVPDFLKDYRALLIENKEFSYEKAKSGSFKDVVPTVYHLGYLLISYGKEKYGDEFWDSIFVDGSSPNNFTPFSNELKKKTGLTSTEFYLEAMKYYKEKFKKEKFEEYEQVSLKLDIPTNYRYSFKYKNSLISLKKSYDEKASFYEIDNRNEKKILGLGILSDDYFELKNNKIIWAEIEPDLRNEKVNYSNIKIYDLDKNEKINLTKNSYYYSPSISNNGDSVAVIINNGLENSIDILDFKGKLLKKVRNSEECFYNYVKWSEDDKRLVVILRDKNGKMGIKSIDIDTQEEKDIIPFGNYIISSPFMYKNNLYFSGSFELVENIYKVNLDTKLVTKVTDSRIGTNYPTVYDDVIYFSEYSLKGYSIKKVNEELNKEYQLGSLLDDKKMNFDYLNKTDFKLIDNKNEKYGVEKYNYLKHMINFHSWYYGYSDNILDLQLLSTNELEDLSLVLAYSEDDNKDKNIFQISGEFTRYWPKYNFLYQNIDEYDKKDSKIGLGMSLPFDFSRGEYGKKVAIDLNYYNYTKDDLKYLTLGTTVLNYKYKSLRDIVSENSQNFKVEYTQDIDESKNSKILAKLKLTSKGIKINDGFSYGISLEDNKGDKELIDNEVFSRGYEIPNYKKSIKNSFDYYYPISYPDFGSKGFFLKRVTGNLFYDNTLVETDETKNYDSIGNSFNFDVMLFSVLPLNLQLQYAYLIEKSEANIALGFQLYM